MSVKKRMGRERRFISPQLKDKVRERDQWTCRMCLTSVDDLDTQLEVHHIRPVNMGGRDRFNNLISLCSSCHSGVHYDEDCVKFWIQPLRKYVQLLKETGVHMALIEVVNTIKQEENESNEPRQERSNASGGCEASRSIYA